MKIYRKPSYLLANLGVLASVAGVGLRGLTVLAPIPIVVFGVGLTCLCIFAPVAYAGELRTRLPLELAIIYLRGLVWLVSLPFFYFGRGVVAIARMFAATVRARALFLTALTYGGAVGELILARYMLARNNDAGCLLALLASLLFLMRALVALRQVFAPNE